MTVEDWALEAAKIIDMSDSDTSVEDKAEIIRDYSPFEKDVAYMPVPMCDGCRHWNAKIEGCPRIMPGSVVLVHGNFGCVQWEKK